MGTLHGGILCDIGDAAMGMTFASTLAPDESLTVELKINFFVSGASWREIFRGKPQGKKKNTKKGTHF